MNKIEIQGMEFYAYHGHFDAEKVVGNQFLVDLYIETNLAKAGKSDNLADALDYQKLYILVKKQMEIISNLLENIAHRILSALYNEFKNISHASVKVAKLNPTMGGKINQVSITMSR